MVNEYFVHFGIIIVPLLVYQLWAFRKSFYQLPYATPIVGIYGGLAAILSEMYPIHILHIGFDLKYIPLVLSFLYGKRYAGLISLTIAIVYRLTVGHFHTGAWLAALSMALYCLPPYLVSRKFHTFSTLRRIFASVALSFIATLIQLLFTITYFAVHLHSASWSVFKPYTSGIIVGSVLQLLLIVPAVLILTQIVNTGHVRLQLLHYQRSLHDSREQYKSFLEYNPNGVSLTNKVGHIVYINPAYENILGYSFEEMLTQDRLQMWTDRDVAYDVQQRALQGEVIANLEVQLRHKDGDSIPAQLTVLPSVVSDQIYGYYAIVSDLRSMKKAEDMMRRADKLTTVGELAAGIAHEIRNPLTSLKGFLKLMQSENLTANRYLSVMDLELDRLESVSERLMVLAKPEVEQKTWVDLQTTVADVVEIIEGQALLASVTIQLQLAGTDTYVYADENQFKQVLINVMKNAIEATPPDGSITVWLESTSTDVTICVEDTGTGIPEDVLARIGEPFYSTKTTGNGLGLMVSHRIIEQHGGAIRYENRSPHGTRVVIHVPLLNQRPSNQKMVYPALTLAAAERN